MDLLRRLGLAALLVLALGSHVRGVVAVLAEELACACVGCVMDREPVEASSCCVDEEPSAEPRPGSPVVSSPASEGCPCGLRPLDEGTREPLAGSSGEGQSKARSAHLALGSSISGRTLVPHGGRGFAALPTAEPPGTLGSPGLACCAGLRLSGRGDAWSVAVLGQALI